jgi:hypothetical protein
VTLSVFERSLDFARDDIGVLFWHEVNDHHVVPSLLPPIGEILVPMPEQETIERAREDAREGKSPSTQAGEFVREEMEHIREGKHGARSAKQAIAIGLSKARRAGVPLPPPRKGTTSRRTRKQAKRDTAKARNGSRRPNPKRSRAVKQALKKEPRSAASHRALSRQAHSAARKRSAGSRSLAAKKAARTRKRSR